MCCYLHIHTAVRSTHGTVDPSSYLLQLRKPDSYWQCIVFPFCPTHFRTSPVCRCVSLFSGGHDSASSSSRRRYGYPLPLDGNTRWVLDTSWDIWPLYTAKVYRVYLLPGRVQYGWHFIPPVKEKGDRKSFITYCGLYIKCTVLCNSPDGESTLSLLGQWWPCLGTEARLQMCRLALRRQEKHGCWWLCDRNRINRKTRTRIKACWRPGRRVEKLALGCVWDSLQSCAWYLKDNYMLVWPLSQAPGRSWKKLHSGLLMILDTRGHSAR